MSAMEPTLPRAPNRWRMPRWTECLAEYVGNELGAPVEDEVLGRTEPLDSFQKQFGDLGAGRLASQHPRFVVAG